MKALVFGLCGAALMFLTCAFVAGTWDTQAWGERLWAAIVIWAAGVVAAALGGLE